MGGQQSSYGGTMGGFPSNFGGSFNMGGNGVMGGAHMGGGPAPSYGQSGQNFAVQSSQAFGNPNSQAPGTAFGQGGFQAPYGQPLVRSGAPHGTYTPTEMEPWP